MAPLVGNALLQVLSEPSQKQLLKQGRYIRLPQHKVLYTEGERPSQIYFMESGLACIVVDMPEGEQVEVGMIGCDGVVGATIALGALNSGSRCVMQMDSTAIAVPLSVVSDAMATNAEIRQRLLEFVQAYLFGTQRIAACHRVHHATERLVRWLLTSQLHARSSKFQYTHELLAQMTAVQRTTVSAAMNQLQSEGLLAHGWGTVTLLDLAGLEVRACSCFSAIKLMYADLYKAQLRAQAPV